MTDLDPFGDRHGPAGEWSGSYEHDSPSGAGRCFPIHATIRVAAGRLEGEMVDDVTEFAYGLGKILDNARHIGLTTDPGLDAILERHPKALVRSSLPGSSTLRGRARGERIAFTKTYHGSESTILEVGGNILSTRVGPTHRVHYAGRFDAMSDVIEGT